MTQIALNASLGDIAYLKLSILQNYLFAYRTDPGVTSGTELVSETILLVLLQPNMLISKELVQLSNVDWMVSHGCRG